MNENKQENTPINKRQETFNGILISLMLKLNKVNQLLSQLFDANNYGETYLFEDFNIINDEQFKRVQSMLVDIIGVLSNQNVNVMKHYTKMVETYQKIKENEKEDD